MPSLVGFEKLRNIRHQGIIGIRVRQKRANTEQYLANGQCRTPLVLENVETNAAIRINVAVVDACGEMDLGRLHWGVSE
jgi:hypothetical protein